MERKTPLRGLASILLLCLLAGCAGSVEFPSRSCTGMVPALDIPSQGATTPDILDLPAMMGRIVEGDIEDLPAPRRVARPVVDIHILALSTGGQYGAFAAGFMSGWSEAGTRSEFDLVTGASAGGTIAPLIFAGPEFNDRLKLLRDIGERDVVRSNGFLGLITGAPSLYSTKPLEARIRGAVDPALLDAIAARWRDKNELLLGATDLRSGRFEVLHVGEYVAQTADGDALKTDCVTDAVMATSAIPGLFPPRQIGGALYADAGLREHIFIADLARELRLAGARQNADLRITATLLVNSDLQIRRDPLEKVSLQPLATRSFELVIDEGLRNSLLNTIRAAEREGWHVRGLPAPKFEDLGCDKAPDRDDLFSKCITRKLFDRGHDLASGRIPWLGPDELRREIMRF